MKDLIELDHNELDHPNQIEKSQSSNVFQFKNIASKPTITKKNSNELINTYKEYNDNINFLNTINDKYKSSEETKKSGKNVTSIKNKNEPLNETTDQTSKNYILYYKNEALSLLQKTENRSYIDTTKYGHVQGLVANSFINIKNENLNKITIIPNIIIDIGTNYSPNINLYGIFIGDNNINGIKERVIHYILQHELFLIKTYQCILESFKLLEEEIRNELKKNLKNSEEEVLSRSSAILVLIIDDICYLINLGDNKGILAIDNNVFSLTKIIINRKITTENSDNKNFSSESDKEQKVIGNLSTNKKLGILVPELICFRLSKEMDFILIANNAIFEKLNNSFILQLILEALAEAIENNQSIEELYNNCVMRIYSNAIEKGITESLSCIIIFLENFKNNFLSKNVEKINCLLSQYEDKENIFFSYYIKKNFNEHRMSTNNEYLTQNLKNVNLLNKNS